MQRLLFAILLAFPAGLLLFFDVTLALGGVLGTLTGTVVWVALWLAVALYLWRAVTPRITVARAILALSWGTLLVPVAIFAFLFLGARLNPQGPVATLGGTVSSVIVLGPALVLGVGGGAILALIALALLRSAEADRASS